MTTTPENDPILRKIRGLLALAEDPACTPAEADTYAAKAEALMVKHAIDVALLDASRPGTKAKPGQTRIDVPGGYAIAKASLLTVLAQAFGARALYSSARGQTPSVILVGFPTDIAAVETLYTSLLLQGANALAKESRSDRAFRNAFWHTFAGTTGGRVTDEREEAVRQAEADQRAAQAATGAPATTGAALVLADRGREVDTYVRQEFGKVHTKRASYSDQDGARAGRAAGEAANLGQRGRVGTGTRAAIGA